MEPSENKEPFQEDEVERKVLTRKPVCFLIIGKPGSGKTTLAKRLAAVWKCQLVDGSTTIEQAIRDGTLLGSKAKEKLLQGEQLEESFVAEIILEKLHSPEIKHYGYVLDGLPSPEEEWKSVREQLQVVQDLDLPPDIIINLKIPDQDLLTRRLGQKVDPFSNELFIKAVYDPQLSPGEEKDKEGKGEEGNEENEEGEEEDNQKQSKERDEFEEDLAELENLQHRAPEIAGRLVTRPQDMENTVQQHIQNYRKNMLRNLEDFIIQHNQQHVIELDANLSPKELFRALLVRLTVLGMPRMPAPKRLVNPEEEEEEEEPEADTDQFLQQLSSTGCLLPNFRWRRSRWGRYCPVQLAAGNLVQGRMEFSVGFLDKMYSMSSSEALVDFTRNPRAYLLPPQPRIPCKVCVIGPPTSGKSTLAQKLADHYNAMVLDMTKLLEPVLKEAREVAVEEAKREAEKNAIISVTAELSTRTSTNGDEEVTVPEVTTEHPNVREAIEEAETKARSATPEITADMFTEALKNGIDQAQQKRRESDPSGPQFGGWVVDGFPLSRENWAAMIEHEVLPDTVLTLDDENTPADYLLSRFTQQHGLPHPSTFKQKKEDVGDKLDQSSNASEEITEWEKKRGEYQRQLKPLVAAIKGSAIDPVILDCSLSCEELVKVAVAHMESVFDLRPMEYTVGDEDGDMDDDPILEEGDGDGEEGEGEQENEAAARKRKPWGDTVHFCPVALKEQGVLWPGNEEYALRYRERLYYFSSEEAKEAFSANFSKYLAADKPLEPPPLRVFLLGPRGCGKTVVGRMVATQLHVFHIAFRDYLQEQILPKMKRPPLIAEDEWDPGEEVPQETLGEEQQEDNELDEDVREPLLEEEAELRAYLLHGEALSENTMDKYTSQFWDVEPYKSSGFIMEGFPSNADELQFLASKGRFPDTAVIMQVESADVVKRLLDGRFQVWKRKKERRLEKRAQAKEVKKREWEEEKQRRKEELTAQYEAKMIARKEQRADEVPDEEDEVEEDENDSVTAEYQEQIAELEAEEMEEEEEEEEEEEDQDARQRMKGVIIEQFEEENEAVTSLRETFAELQVPFQIVNAARRIPVVEYALKKALSPFTCDRQGLLTKCTPIDLEMAKKLLDHGYKQLSKFKRWCPVELSQNPHAVLPPQRKGQQACPVIYGSKIYFPFSQEAQNKFTANPEFYLRCQKPGPSAPIRLAIVGPPKSGKSTAARKICDTYGCFRLSIGEAIRRVLSKFPQSELAQQMQSYLKSGQTIPEELCVLALDSALLDFQCTTRGYVLDGWPLTKSQVELLTKFRIVPVVVVELEISDQEMLRRAQLDRNSPARTYPVHDSAAILLVRSGNYHKHVESVKEWYKKQHNNWFSVDGEKSHWWVWEKVRQCALTSARQIQLYLARITSGQAASVYGLCISPAEFKARLGEFSHYCPVSLAQGELVDCSEDTSLIYSAEFRGKYYKMAGEEELAAFLSQPERFVAPAAPRPLPSSDLLPKRCSHISIKTMFPKKFEFQGFCPVTYVDGGRRYECLVPGSPSLAAEYKNKLFCFAHEEQLERFMRQPHHYEDVTLPAKLPPRKQPLPLTSLPMLGYLEQTVATSVINSLSSVGAKKPKHPFVDATKSALVYMAYHLKAYNPKSSEYIRKKYKKKLAYFEERCSLIGYLSSSMSHGYQEPTVRPIDFNHKMDNFLGLKQSVF